MNRWKYFLAGLLAISLLSAAHGQTFNILHSFSRTVDGLYPSSDLLLSGSTLYGTMDAAVFKMNVDGTGAGNIHSFIGDPLRQPQGGLALSGGTLYGATVQCQYSIPYGGIYSLNTDGTGYMVLHTFSGGSSDGKTPFVGPTLYGSTLYGVTAMGGTSNAGVLYQLQRDGTGFSVMHAFLGGTSDGSSPEAPLLVVGSTLYGTTMSGGAYNNGTVFRVNADGSNYQILHSFAVTEGGANLSGLIQVGSALVGANMVGGGHLGMNGTIFKLNPDGTDFQVLHRFIGGANDGLVPTSSLTAIGSTIYGTTSQGGSSNKGVLFQIDLDGTDFNLLHTFTGGSGDGASPSYNGIVVSGSTLYGMTRQGGPNDQGVVYSLTVPEPSTIALLGVGATCLLVHGRRRRK
jgi:uncharacterized repeat protein (TIGR03803 family)